MLKLPLHFYTPCRPSRIGSCCMHITRLLILILLLVAVVVVVVVVLAVVVRVPLHRCWNAFILFRKADIQITITITITITIIRMIRTTTSTAAALQKRFWTRRRMRVTWTFSERQCPILPFRVSDWPNSTPTSMP